VGSNARASAIGTRLGNPGPAFAVEALVRLPHVRMLAEEEG
jgi:hypothetical protein